MPLRRRQEDPEPDLPRPDRLDEVLAQVARERAGDQDPWPHRADLVHGGQWTPEPVLTVDRRRRAAVIDLSGSAEVADDEDGPRQGRHRPRPVQPAAPSQQIGGRRARPLTVPVALRGADLRVTPVAVVGLLLVVLVVAAVLVVRVWLVQDRAAPREVAPLSADQSAGVGLNTGGRVGGAPTADTGANTDAVPAGGSVLQPGSTTGPTAAPAASPTMLVVHVDGAVRRPGVVRLDQGSRVQDAVAAAGGLTDRADTSRVNLAQALTDGERVWVPVPGEDPPVLVSQGYGALGPGGAPPGGAGPAAAATPLPLNTADQAQLEELPGVGPVTAQRILAWRQEHGRFTSVDELLEVSGIGERTLEQLRPLVTL